MSEQSSWSFLPLEIWLHSIWGELGRNNETEWRQRGFFIPTTKNVAVYDNTHTHDTKAGVGVLKLYYLLQRGFELNKLRIWKKSCACQEIMNADWWWSPWQYQGIRLVFLFLFNFLRMLTKTTEGEQRRTNLTGIIHLSENFQGGNHRHKPRLGKGKGKGHTKRLLRASSSA